MDTEDKAFLGKAGMFLAFFVGAAAGAVAGVFFAPDSGDESRRKVAGWLKEKRENGKKEVQARKERVEAAIRAGKEAFKEHKDKLAGV